MANNDRLHELQTMPYEQYLLTPEWQERRQLMLERAGHRCQICNSSSDLQVHHRTYERRGNENLGDATTAGDLTVLCQSCHEKFHDRLPAQEKSHAFVKMLDVAKAFLSEKPYRIHGVPTGFDSIDLALAGGLQKSDLILIGGRTRVGKTAFALKIAYNSACQQQKVAFFSLEMKKTQLYQRLVAMISRIDLFRLRQGWIEKDDVPVITAAQRETYALPLWINDTTMTIEEIYRQTKQLIAEQQGIDLVIVDYLGFIETNKSYSTVEQKISFISRSLKLMAREFDIPVVVLCQLSRSLENRYDKTPVLTDLRDSGSQEQDADVVLFIHREGIYDNSVDQKEAKIIIAKQRNGPTSSWQVRYHNEYTLFEDYSRDDE